MQLKLIVSSWPSDHLFNHHLLSISIKQEQSMLRKISPGNDFDNLLRCDGAHGSAGWVELKLVLEALIEPLHLLLQELAITEGLEVLREAISLRNEV